MRDYCKQEKIFVPKNSTPDTVAASIVRVYLHGKTIERSSCFGFWQNENSTCMTCDFEKKCFKASFGMEKAAYEKALHTADNPQSRYSAPLKKRKPRPKNKKKKSKKSII